MADWVINRRKATITCSKCKAKLNANLFMDLLEAWNFCPYCGADMRAEQTEPIGRRGEMMSQKEFDEMVHRVVSGQTEPKCEECEHYGHKVERCLLNKCKYE